MILIEKLLSAMPTSPLAILIIVVTSAASTIGLLLIRRWIPARFLKAHHELTGPIFQVLATAYAVLLAFVVVVSWQNYDQANVHLEAEANNLVDLHRGAAAFPQVFQDQVRAAIHDYADLVIQDEWPLMANGGEGLKAREGLRRIWALYTSYEPRTEKEKAFFAEAVSKLDDLREMRRLRLIESKTMLHPLLQFLLILGGIITIGFSLCFGAENFVPHAVMAAALAVLIALILFLILLFDYPFTGSAGISPEAFRQIIHF